MATAPATEASLISGADILVQSLVDHGVEVIFAYPGGASMPLHQALTRFKDKIRTILPRHEQGGAFAAQGYARTTFRNTVIAACYYLGIDPSPLAHWVAPQRDDGATKIR